MEATPAASPVPSPPRPPASHQRITMLEILGYCGIAAGLFGTFAVLAETSGDPADTVKVTAIILAAVFLAAGALIGEDAPDRLARMRSTCWFASVVAFFTFLAFVIEPTDKAGFVLLFAVAAVYALALWVFSPRLLQQLAFFFLALSAVAFLVGFPNLGSFFFGPPNITGIALTYWVGGALWFALGYQSLVRPPRTAMVIGFVIGIEGISLLAQDAPEASAVLILASSAVCLYLGGSRGDRAVTGLAVVGLLIGIGALLTVLEVEGTGPGIATMILGVASLGIGVWLARSGPGGPRPMFGLITSPFGRPGPRVPDEPPPPGTTTP
jgi:hypothetical protein